MHTPFFIPHLERPEITKGVLEHDLLLDARLRVDLHDVIARQYAMAVTQGIHDDVPIPPRDELLVLSLPRGWRAVKEIALERR